MERVHNTFLLSTATALRNSCRHSVCTTRISAENTSPKTHRSIPEARGFQRTDCHHATVFLLPPCALPCPQPRTPLKMRCCCCSRMLHCGRSQPTLVNKKGSRH